ncbi:MAG: hypothetical protein PWP47_212 [Synergistaceae bacterium]|nr:hypothetical protein [Synergistaceae bacterium]
MLFFPPLKNGKGTRRFGKFLKRDPNILRDVFFPIFGQQNVSPGEDGVFQRFLNTLIDIIQRFLNQNVLNKSVSNSYAKPWKFRVSFQFSTYFGQQWNLHKDTSSKILPVKTYHTS